MVTTIARTVTNSSHGRCRVNRFRSMIALDFDLADILHTLANCEANPISAFRKNRVASEQGAGPARMDGEMEYDL